MGKRLTVEERVLRNTHAPKVGVVVAYGNSIDGYRIGRVEEVDVELDDPWDPRVLLTLSNGKGPRWLAYWDSMQVAIVPMLSDPR